MEKIGFVGLGIMGKPMCLNLIKAGFHVTAWNRTTSKMNEVVTAGAISATSPKEVAENSDIIITIVSDSPDVQAVILGDDGIFHGAQAGSVVIDMSTISPAVTRDITKKLAEKNVGEREVSLADDSKYHRRNKTAGNTGNIWRRYRIQIDLCEAG